ncbi:hypothetical protein D3C84_1233330 [compost metagenome]
MRIPGSMVMVETNHIQQLFNPFFTFSTASGHTVNIQCFADDIRDRKTRIKRCVRILEDHLHIATHSFHFAG